MRTRSPLALLGAPLFASVLVTGLGAQRAPERPLSRQAPEELGVRLRTRGAPRLARMDLDTGRVELQARSMAAACFDNSIDDDMWADALLYPAGFELFDWGVKGCAASNFVDRIRIGYASQAQPMTSGGPGGSLILRIYEGATGYGVSGVLRQEIRLSGLPSAGPPVGGFLIPFETTIKLEAESFFLPDGPIAWSYENTDGLTAPLLVDVVPSTGTQLAYDVYNPGPASPASYKGTFALGPGGASNDPKENSFYLRILQNDVTAQSVAIVAGSNPNNFQAAPPIIGSTWNAWVDLSGVPGARSTLLAVSRTRLSGVRTEFGELIVDPSTLMFEVSVGLVDSHRHPIPLDATLLGSLIYAQGGYFTASGLQLTNGAEPTVGSY